MKTLSLVLNYASEASEPEVSIEQEPIADNSLTVDDLINMTALARQGVSANLYRPDTCNVAVVDGKVLTDLTFFTWPKPLSLPYELKSNYGNILPAITIQQEREFDFVINKETKIRLPFSVSSVSYSLTQLPFFNSIGEVAPAPVVTFDEMYAYVDSVVIGVIRLKCVANGYSHTLSLSFDKGDRSFSNYNISVSATYYNSSDTMKVSSAKVELPGCLELLLQTCGEDLITEHRHGSVINRDEKIPVVYYSDCDGNFLALRYENP